MELPQRVGQRVAYDITRPCRDGEETAIVQRNPDGSFHGDVGNFDFTAKDEAECRTKLARWGYTALVSKAA